MLLTKKPRTETLRLTLSLPADLSENLKALKDLAGKDGYDLDVQGAVVRYLRRAVPIALKAVNESVVSSSSDASKFADTNSLPECIDAAHIGQYDDTNQ